MRATRECLKYPVHKLCISKRYQKDLETDCSQIYFFPIQTAVTHTTLFNCTRFYYFVIITGKIHAPPWNQFLELIYQNRFVCAWICRCVSAGAYIFSPDWSFWGLKFVKKRKSQLFCITITTKIRRYFDLGFPQCIFSDKRWRWCYKQDKAWKCRVL